jgi:hypothetical protein
LRKKPVLLIFVRVLHVLNAFFLSQLSCFSFGFNRAVQCEHNEIRFYCRFQF